MLIDRTDIAIYGISELYFEKAVLALLQKSVILLIIQGVLVTFSVWDKNSGFFVILAAIGVYSVHGSISVRVSLRRMETAVKKLFEIKSRQFVRLMDNRNEEPPSGKEIFIPEKEREKVHTAIFKEKLCSVFQKSTERIWIYG